MRRALPPLLLLAACSTDAPRRFFRVEAADDEPVAEWSPDLATPDDTGAADLWEDQATQDCGGVNGDPGWGVGDRLAADWCVRISPEPGSDVFGGNDTGDLDTGGVTGPLDPAPPPCSFANLVGAIDLAGGSGSASALYCDSDGDGGVRLATYDPADATVRTRLLHERDCVADGDSGVLVQTDTGWTAWWATLGTGEDGARDPGVLAADLDETGDIVGGWRYVLTGGAPYRVQRLQGQADQLLVLDSSGPLTAWPLAGGAIAGEARVLADPVRSFGALADDATAWVATCDDFDDLSLHRLADTVESAEVPDAECGFVSRPSLAASGSGDLALAWDDGSAGFLAGIDPTGAVAWRTELGSAALVPRVLAWDGGWLTLDATGRVRAWDASGGLRWEAWHAGIADVPGTVIGLRVAVDGDRLTVLHLGMDVVDLGLGHVSTFNSVELSRVVLRD